jgi:hypothetical protein
MCDKIEILNKRDKYEGADYSNKIDRLKIENVSLAE